MCIWDRLTKSYFKRLLERFMVENIEEDLKATSISSKVILNDRVWRKNYRGAMVLKILSSITRNPWSKVEIKRSVT